MPTHVQYKIAKFYIVTPKNRTQRLEQKKLWNDYHALKINLNSTHIEKWAHFVFLANKAILECKK